MKKGLIGCLVVGLLVVVVGGGAAYWFVLRPMWSAGSALVGNAKGLAAAAEVEDTIANKSPFTAPADGKLTQAQVQGFVAVQSAMQSALGADLDALKAKYDAIDAAQKAKGREADLSEVMGAYSDFSGYILKAKQAQAAALNQQNLSLEEYRWVRQQAFAALPFVEMDEATLAALSAAPPLPAEAPAAPSVPPEVAAGADDASATASDAGAAAPADPAAAQMAAAAANMASAAADMASAAASAQKAALDTPEMQAAKANAALLKPYKELIEKTAGTTWLGF